MLQIRLNPSAIQFLAAERLNCWCTGHNNEKSEMALTVEYSSVELVQPLFCLQGLNKKAVK